MNYLFQAGNLIFTTMIANKEAEIELEQIKFGLFSFLIHIYNNSDYFGKIGR